MALTRVRAAKDLAFLRYLAEQRIEAAAAATRGRFATPGKHAIYQEKREEARAYLRAVQRNDPIDMDDYPYLAAETGITAATPGALAQLWIDRDAAWKQAAPLVEKLSVRAKALARAARGPAEIEQEVQAALAALDAIGDKPPAPPKPDRLPRPDRS
jgi:hypothetical protein